jgi:hypothetical protein
MSKATSPQWQTSEAPEHATPKLGVGARSGAEILDPKTHLRV